MNGTKRELLEKRIIIALVILLALSIAYTKARIVKTPAAAKEGAPSDANIKKPAAIDKSTAMKGAVAYRGEAIRDPFRKPDEVAALEREPMTGASVTAKTGEREPEFKLEGVIWGGAKNLAIISGSVLSEGETINGAKVIQIKRNSVIISKGGSKIELKR